MCASKVNYNHRGRIATRNHDTIQQSFFIVKKKNEEKNYTENQELIK